MKIGNAQVWVHDQDEAIAFYTEKLGMEVRADASLPEMGDFRWVTVAPPGQDDVAIVLMAIPGPPMIDEATAQQIRDLMAKRLAPARCSSPPTTCRRRVREARMRGASSSPRRPRRVPYGIDSGFRDPSGNSFRLTQVTEDWA